MSRGAARCAVPLNAMCSSMCATPLHRGGLAARRALAHIDAAPPHGFGMSVRSATRAGRWRGASTRDRSSAASVLVMAATQPASSREIVGQTVKRSGRCSQIGEPRRAMPGADRGFSTASGNLRRMRRRGVDNGAVAAASGLRPLQRPQPYADRSHRRRPARRRAMVRSVSASSHAAADTKSRLRLAGRGAGR